MWVLVSCKRGFEKYIDCQCVALISVTNIKHSISSKQSCGHNANSVLQRLLRFLNIFSFQLGTKPEHSKILHKRTFQEKKLFQIRSSLQFRCLKNYILYKAIKKNSNQKVISRGTKQKFSCENVRRRWSNMLESFYSLFLVL